MKLSCSLYPSVNLTELFRLEGTSGDGPVQTPYQGRVAGAPSDTGTHSGGFDCLQRGRLHGLPGTAVPVLSPPPCKVLHCEVQLLVFQFMAIAPCSVPGHH